MVRKNALGAIIACFSLCLAGLALAQARSGRPMQVDGVIAPAMAQTNPNAAPGPAKVLHLTFPLASSRAAGLEAFIDTLHDPASPNYHHWLTPQQVGQRFGASDADIKAVVDYLQTSGFNVTHVWPSRLLISADATVAQAEQVFGIKISGYDRPADLVAQGEPATFYAPDRAVSVPPAVAGRISGVFGLSDLIHMHPQRRFQLGQETPVPPPSLPGLSTPDLSGPALGGTPQFTHPLAPADISKVYDLDDIHARGLHGEQMFIGIFSPTNVNDSDINHFASYFGITGYTIYHSQIDGGATNSNGAIEACLDAEMIIGQANKCSVVFYESPNNGNLDVWARIAADDLPVISDSWSIDEKYVHSVQGGDQYIAQWNTMLAIMDAEGMAQFNASGDNGAYNYQSGVLSIGFPGSSQHVTCCGGTTLPNDNNGAWKSETGWGGSGGGISIYIKQPTWQSGPGVSNSYSNGMRQTPDIAAIADGNTPGIYVYSGGSWYQVGGTSAVAPLWSAVDLLIDQALPVTTGNLNPFLYFAGANMNAGYAQFIFHDITSGNNGYYSCTSGWDFVTGWGSAVFFKLFADIALPPNLLPYNPGSNGPGGTWTSPLMIHSAAGSVTEPSTFDDATTYYFAGAIADNTVSDAPICRQSIQIDGVDNKFLMGPFAGTTPSQTYYMSNLQAYSGKLTAGTHTIKLIANVDNTVTESSTSDNTYSRTITVYGSAAGVTLAPTTVAGGAVNSTGTVQLSGAAPPNGATVSLSSSDTTLATVPQTVTVQAGQTTSAPFTVTTFAVTTNKSVVITATYPANTSQTATLNLTPAGLASLSVNPATVSGGHKALGTVTLYNPAPASGAVVTLKSSSTAVVVPTTVTVPAGKTSVLFSITTKSVTTDTTANLTATYNGVTQKATLQVLAVHLASLTFNPSTVQGGLSTMLTATLTAPSSTSVTVKLTNSDATTLSAPASITIPAHTLSVSVLLDTSVVSTNKTVTLKGTVGTVTQTATLNVTP